MRKSSGLEEEAMRMMNEDDTMISTIYEASLQGCVSTLSNLIQKDPLILTKLSLTTIAETPLHISASLGHLPFTRTLLLHKPKLASELNSLRRSPLHLASAEGHTEIVQELLKAYDKACLLADQDGRVPLHYAVMRGRADIVRELIRARPESLMVLDGSESVFHLCVKYNQLKTLRVLVEVVGDKNEMLSLRDCNTRNTILHLAVMLKQTENIRYLLSLPAVRAEASAENKMGFTAIDILEHNPSDFRSLQIRCLLMDAGINRKNNKFEDLPPLPKSRTPIAVPDQARRPRKKTWWRKCLKQMDKWFKTKGEQWFEETRGNLMVVATVISTMSFQALMNPPSGVMQGRYAWPFVVLNTISFAASLSITLLLISGLPLNHKFGMWLLSVSMCLNLSVLSLAFGIGVEAVIPDSFREDVEATLGLSLVTWIALLGLVGLFLTIRFLFWVGKTVFRRFNRKRSRASRNIETSLINLT